MMRDAYGAPASFYSKLSAAAFEFIDEEARDFNPYRRQLTARELFEEVKDRFGLDAVDGLDLWIH